MEDKISRPPIGIKPKRFHDEARWVALREAINRYLDAGLTVSVEWVSEYNDLTVQLFGNNNERSCNT